MHRGGVADSDRLDCDARCCMTFTFEQAWAYFSHRITEGKIPHRGTFTTRCPFHGDRTASMSVNLDKGGLWNCHACNIGGGIYDFESHMSPTRSNNERWESIYKITGAEPSPSQGKYVPKGPVIATYQYVAPDGKLLFEKQRHEPKSFTQRAPNGSGGWKYSLEGVRKVLYRLPEVMAAQVVFIAEGEKDVEALRALELEVGYKVAATCNFDGAGKWKDEYSPYFAGKRVVIFPDNDEPGRLHAQTVATSALKFSESVKVVELPGLPEKGDVADP